MQTIFSLEGKVILITGASSGIGKAVALQCAAAGATCIITARNEKRLQETFDGLRGEGHKMILADLSSLLGVNTLLSHILGKIDGVVACAGIVETKILKFTEDEDLMRLFDTNAFSSIRLIRELVQQKKLQNGASVVMISSISGTKCGYIGGALYGATKGALEGFVKATALELSPKRVRVNTIVPGMIETSLLEGSEIGSEELEADKLRYPLKRYEHPDEIGYASVYLLSDATMWMTGTSLLIDGGYTLN